MSPKERTDRTTSSQRKEESESIASFIPLYLRPYINPYHGDFCFTRSFHAGLIAQLMSEGFLPIATEGILLPKLHQKRCVISLPESLHVSKSVRKKSKKFQITINKAFDDVVAGCKDQHGSHCWLYPPLVDAFRTIKRAGKVDAALVVGGRQPTGRVCPVRLYSVEIWNVTTGALAGGELGYTVGSIYTSLTGFSREDSAGSVQLAAVGRLLCHLGFTFWDLGMEMEYKNTLGSQLMPRKTFVKNLQKVRESHGHMILRTNDNNKDEPVNARVMIDLPPASVIPPSSSPITTTTTTTTSTTEASAATVQQPPSHERPMVKTPQDNKKQRKVCHGETKNECTTNNTA